MVKCASFLKSYMDDTGSHDGAPVSHMRVGEVRRVEVKRNMDLIRDLLLRVEADPSLDGSRWVVFDTSDFPDHSQEEIAYHIDLLFEADFVKGLANLDAPAAAISRLTCQDHEFIADISDAGVWASVKERIKGLPDVGLAIVWELAKAELKKRFHLDK